MKKIIFLDFDGVLDTEFYDYQLIQDGKSSVDEFGPIFDPVCVDALRFIIEQTGADIVVSSTWKDSMTMDELHNMWKKRQLPGHVIGTTPNVNYDFRGDEIDAYLNQISSDVVYAIIDDMDASQFSEQQLSSLYMVNPYNGLDQDLADRIVNRLNH